MMTCFTPAGLVTVLSILVTQVRPSTWSYEECSTCALDPKHWKPEVCQSGKNQSPINIGSRNIVVRRNLPGLNFHRFDKPFNEVDIQNNGHSLMITPLGNTIQSISGAMLPSSYNIEQLHFHWGNHSDTGSEHTIDNKRYPLEMHLVHYNSKYKSVAEAVEDNERNGLAVISVLFEISRKDNEHFEPIMQKAKAVRGTDAEVVSRVGLGGVSLADLLPKTAAKSFFSYEGSLTTPPCAEVVTWMVLKEKGTISERQIQAFR